jgi:hypothetical protein
LALAVRRSKVEVIFSEARANHHHTGHLDGHNRSGLLDP